jgi:hypothetical protein
MPRTQVYVGDQKVIDLEVEAGKYVICDGQSVAAGDSRRLETSRSKASNVVELEARRRRKAR